MPHLLTGDIPMPRRENPRIQKISYGPLTYQIPREQTYYANVDESSMLRAVTAFLSRRWRETVEDAVAERLDAFAEGTEPLPSPDNEECLDRELEEECGCRCGTFASLTPLVHHLVQKKSIKQKYSWVDDHMSMGSVRVTREKITRNNQEQSRKDAGLIPHDQLRETIAMLVCAAYGELTVSAPLTNADMLSRILFSQRGPGPKNIPGELLAAAVVAIGMGGRAQPDCDDGGVCDGDAHREKCTTMRKLIVFMLVGWRQQIFPGEEGEILECVDRVFRLATGGDCRLSQQQRSAAPRPMVLDRPIQGFDPRHYRSNREAVELLAFLARPVRGQKKGWSPVSAMLAARLFAPDGANVLTAKVFEALAEASSTTRDDVKNVKTDIQTLVWILSGNRINYVPGQDTSVANAMLLMNKDLAGILGTDLALRPRSHSRSRSHLLPHPAQEDPRVTVIKLRGAAGSAPDERYDATDVQLRISEARREHLIRLRGTAGSDWTGGTALHTLLEPASPVAVLGAMRVVVAMSMLATRIERLLWRSPRMTNAEAISLVAGKPDGRIVAATLCAVGGLPAGIDMGMLLSSDTTFRKGLLGFGTAGLLSPPASIQDVKVAVDDMRHMWPRDEEWRRSTPRVWAKEDREDRESRRRDPLGLRIRGHPSIVPDLFVPPPRPLWPQPPPISRRNPSPRRHPRLDGGSRRSVKPVKRRRAPTRKAPT